MSRRRWAVLPLAVILSGCYSHRVVTPEELQPGTSVRARITAARAEQLSEVLGRESRVLRGRVVGEEEGGVLLQVPGLSGTSGARLDQRVVLPKPEIVEMEVRTLDRTRTGGLVALLTLAGGYLLFQQFDAEGKEDPGSKPKPGGGDQTILAFRWTW